MSTKERAAANATTPEPRAKLVNIFDTDKKNLDIFNKDALKSVIERVGGLLQPEIKGVIEEVADAYAIHSDFTLATALTIVGGVAGNAVKINNKPYCTNLGMWTCLIAPSGYGKTDPLAWLMQPVENMEKEADQRYRSLYAEWRKSKSEDEPPKRESLVLSDYTPEVMYKKLQENPRGIILVCDELLGWLKNFNRYHASGEVQQLLSIWKGVPLHVSRISRPDVYCASPFLSIIGGVQTALVKKAFGNSDLVDMGFCGRFIFVTADTPKDAQITQHEVRYDAAKIWFNYLYEIRHLNDVSLTFSKEAKEYFDIIRQHFKNKQKSYHDTPFLSAMYGKLDIYAIKAAGILHLMSEEFKETHTTVVGLDTIAAGCYFALKAEDWGRDVWSEIKFKGITETPQKDLIKAIHYKIGIKNQSMFAESLELYPSYINRIIRET